MYLVFSSRSLHCQFRSARTSEFAMNIQHLLAPATTPAHKRERELDPLLFSAFDGDQRPNTELVFDGPILAKTHSSWRAFREYLDDYCSLNDVQIGVEFTVSVRSRNQELKASKRSKFVEYLPDDLESFRRMYVCRLGRKTRASGSCTACPFRFTVTSVKRHGHWKVEITRGVFKHDHTEKVIIPAVKRRKQRVVAEDQRNKLLADAVNNPPVNTPVATISASSSNGTVGIVPFRTTVNKPAWFIDEHDIEVNTVNLFTMTPCKTLWCGSWKGSQVGVVQVEAANEDRRAAFLREADLWYKLCHPHVMRMFGACPINPQLFVCEYVESGSLYRYLDSYRDKLWEKLYETALGLQYLHDHGVIYGTVRCRDIVVGQDGRAKLSFGRPTLAAASTPREDKSCKVEPCLTGWMAPELLREEQATFASDVYSFGMCILEVFTETCPWLSPGGDLIPPPVIKYLALRDKSFPSRPKNCPAAVYNLVQRMCRFDPSKRVGLKEVIDLLKDLSFKATALDHLDFDDFDQIYPHKPVTCITAT
ncbi:unnamed protein product [Phytophthora fragariaefolia]|uniref:Unnamed protein product n=1 Tax=Phytophthora fragariaefolia TaxID=1490495 RepID=A0A9W7DCM7_9STRA|nr:unnamed protein product [Phytophthora fragariaefolia]